ncbi:MAG: hypothetical protein AAF985_20915, partial [Bacteroidota bacterium]
MKDIALFFLLFLLTNTLANAQCADADMAVWNNTWESCQSATNPNPERGEGHWIQYDFGSVYTLSSTRIWNANATEKLSAGF